MRMLFTAEFDRAVDPEKHYLSPGGYGVTIKDHDSILFDFIYHVGSVNDENDHLVDFIVSCLDDNFENDEDEEYLENHIQDITGFVEFFMFTGEYDDPEINFVGIKNLTIEANLNSLDESDTDLFHTEIIVGKVEDNDFLGIYTATPKLIKQINDLVKAESAYCK